MKKSFWDALLYVVVFVLAQLLVSYVVFFIWKMAEGQEAATILKDISQGTMPLTAPMLIVTQAVSSLILLIIFFLMRWCRVSRAYLKSKPIGVLFWAAIAALGTIIPSELFQEYIKLPDNNTDLLVSMMQNRWGYLAICIFAPLVEELIFRGAVLKALLEGMHNHWAAIVLSAALFALVHFNPVQMPHAFCLGLLLGWMYYRTGSVIPGIAVHWVNNTVAYVVTNLFPQSIDTGLSEMWGGDMVRVMLAVAFSLCIFIPAVVQLHMRMRRVGQTT